MPMKRIARSAARNPPTFTMPVAVLSRWLGLKVRAWSKPIIDAGPPVPRANASTNRSHSGAGSGQSDDREPRDDLDAR